jgi:thioredoxin reductase (NADPH)
MGKIYDVLIIGGGPSGLSAAIYAGRSKMSVLLLEKGQIGEYSYTMDGVDNYPGIRHTTVSSLMHEMYQQATDFGAEFEQTPIDRADFAGRVKKVFAGDKVYEGRSIILAAGAPPRANGFPCEEKYNRCGVYYSSASEGPFFADRDIFVAGGGSQAAEEALFLAHFAKSVTLIVRKKALSCAKTLAEKVRVHPKIKVLYNTKIVGVTGESEIKSITFYNSQSDKTILYKAPEDCTTAVFVFNGYEPATAAFAGQVKMDESGLVSCDEQMRTSTSGIFAAGDLRSKSMRRILAAVADGEIAAASATRYITDLI